MNCQSDRNKKELLPNAIPSLNVTEGFTKKRSLALEKLNQKRIIQEVLEDEEMELCASELCARSTADAGTQTDLTLLDVLQLPTEPTKIEKQQIVENHLLELGFTEAVAKNMLKNPKRKGKYTQDEVCTALMLKSIRNN